MSWAIHYNKEDGWCQHGDKHNDCFGSFLIFTSYVKDLKWEQWVSNYWPLSHEYMGSFYV